MNLMIASDIHGSARYCRALLAAFAREGGGSTAAVGGGHSLSRAP